MRLDVRLVEYVEPITVTQIIPPRIIWVVARAHGVDVELLHEHDVLHHRLKREGVARVGIVLVAVDAADPQGHAVEANLAVLHLDLAEAHATPLDLHHPTVVILERHEQRVQVRLLGGPLLGIRDGRPKRQRYLGPGVSHRVRTQRFSEYGPTLIIEQVHLDTVALHRPVSEVRDHDVHSEMRVPICLVQRRPDVVVPQVHSRQGQQVHVAEDAAEPPHVLVLQIAAIGPAVDSRRHLVVSHADVARYVELRR